MTKLPLVHIGTKTEKHKRRPINDENNTNLLPKAEMPYKSKIGVSSTDSLAPKKYDLTSLTSPIYRKGNLSAKDEFDIEMREIEELKLIILRRRRMQFKQLLAIGNQAAETVQRKWKAYRARKNNLNIGDRTQVISATYINETVHQDQSIKNHSIKNVKDKIQKDDVSQGTINADFVPDNATPTGRNGSHEDRVVNKITEGHLKEGTIVLDKIRHSGKTSRIDSHCTPQEMKYQTNADPESDQVESATIQLQRTQKHKVSSQQSQIEIVREIKCENKEPSTDFNSTQPMNIYNRPYGEVDVSEDNTNKILTHINEGDDYSATAVIDRVVLPEVRNGEVFHETYKQSRDDPYVVNQLRQRKPKKSNQSVLDIANDFGFEGAAPIEEVSGLDYDEDFEESTASPRSLPEISGAPQNQDSNNTINDEMEFGSYPSNAEHINCLNLSTEQGLEDFPNAGPSTPDGHGDEFWPNDATTVSSRSDGSSFYDYEKFDPKQGLEKENLDKTETISGKETRMVQKAVPESEKGFEMEHKRSHHLGFDHSVPIEGTFGIQGRRNSRKDNEDESPFFPMGSGFSSGAFEQDFMEESSTRKNEHVSNLEFEKPDMSDFARPNNTGTPNAFQRGHDEEDFESDFEDDFEEEIMLT